MNAAVRVGGSPGGDVESPTVGGYARGYLDRLRAGEMGSLPAVFALVIRGITCSVMQPVFLTALNFANLFTQGAAVTVIAMGLIFVLLLGEIDLSAGFASGVCAAVLAVLLVDHHWPWYLAILGALSVGAMIGTVLGLLVTKIGIPSFVVTLAAFLAFQGIALLLIKGGQNVTVSDPAIKIINYDGKLPPSWGWLLYAVSVLAVAVEQIVRRHNRAEKGQSIDPLLIVALRVLGIAGVFGSAVYVLNLERGRNPLISQRGVPVVVVIIAGLLLFWAFVLDRTAYGRHIYAVGGNREAARRAGINVDRIRVSVFVVCSTMAAFGGVIAASQAQSVDANTGGSNVNAFQPMPVPPDLAALLSEDVEPRVTMAPPPLYPPQEERGCGLF